jgi:predicted dehydrogenase
MIGIGMVGAGFWANMIQLPVFQQIPEYNVVGILSRDPANAKKTAAKFNIRKAYNSVTELIMDPEVQVVNICAPNYLHSEIALAAFEHGKDVICIKPLASSLAAAHAMVQAAERAGRLLLYAENVKFIPALTRLKAMVDGGSYGSLFRVKACEGIGKPHADWFRDRRLSGGGCVIDMAVHGLAFLNWFAEDSRPVRIHAEVGTFLHPYDVEDTSVIVVRFENGMIGQTEDSWSLAGGFDSRFEVFGTKGHAHLDLLSGHPIRSALGGATEGGGSLFHYHAAEEHFVKDGHLAMFNHFRDCLLSGEVCRSAGADGLRVMELIDAAYQSITKQHPKEL